MLLACPRPQVGRDYLSGVERCEIPLADYLEYLRMSQEEERGGTAEGEGPPIAYLAQYQLFDQIPELLADLEPAAVRKLMGGEEEYLRNAWIGPRGASSPCHVDPYDNVYVQISGRKFFRLYDPEQRPWLYPYPSGTQTNSSQVDVMRPDLACFPLFAKACPSDVELDPGDALFIPRGYFHYAQNVTLSMSSSFWWPQGRREGRAQPQRSS